MSEMHVCAHMNIGPYQHDHRRVMGIKNAVDVFRDILEGHYGDLAGILERTGEDYAPTLDLYPACMDCNDNMCFHDYPMSRYQVGPRGGIRKVIV